MRMIAAAAVVLSLSAACSRGTVQDAVTRPDQSTERILERAEGLASYYARMLHGRLTASGVPLDLSQMVAAHPHYPFGTDVRVTNLANQRSVEVRIVDRGPAAAPRRDGVIIDLSRAAARQLGLMQDGRARVALEVLKWGDNTAPGD
jgi:rare lipoprotein A